MPPPVLYSTNVYLKLMIQEKYQNDIHFVWCSEYFDHKKRPAYRGLPVAPSSDPALIYRQLKEDVERKDRHSAKITAQKSSLIKLAAQWEKAGEISSDEKKDIAYMVKNADFDHWRPLLYVIPRALEASRLQSVLLPKRASFGEEYIIADLRRNEFDIIEF